jgi:hypothetical protein
MLKIVGGEVMYSENLTGRVNAIERSIIELGAALSADSTTGMSEKDLTIMLGAELLTVTSLLDRTVELLEHLVVKAGE